MQTLLRGYRSVAPRPSPKLSRRERGQQVLLTWAGVIIATFLISQFVALMFFVRFEYTRYRDDRQREKERYMELGNGIKRYFDAEAEAAARLQREAEAEAKRLHELEITPKLVNFTSDFEANKERGAFAFFLGPAGGWGEVDRYASMVESVKVAIYSVSAKNPRYPIVLLITEGIWKTREWQACPDLAEWLLPADNQEQYTQEEEVGDAKVKEEGESGDSEEIPRDHQSLKKKKRPFMVQIVPDVIRILEEKQEAQRKAWQEEVMQLEGKENMKEEDDDGMKEKLNEKYPFVHYKIPKNGFLRKLAIWAIEGFDKVVFLDADTLTIQNIDILMTAEPTPAFKIDHREGDTFLFNSGVGVIRPGKNREVFNDMLDKVPFLPSYDGTDQGLLNSYYNGTWSSGWSRLPEGYNHFKMCRQRSDWEALHNASAAILHYFGFKPPYCVSRTYDCNVELPYHSHFWHRLWWGYYERMIEERYDNGEVEFRCPTVDPKGSYRHLWAFDWPTWRNNATQSTAELTGGEQEEVVDEEDEEGEKTGIKKWVPILARSWCPNE